MHEFVGTGGGCGGGDWERMGLTTDRRFFFFCKNENVTNLMAAQI